MTSVAKDRGSAAAPNSTIFLLPGRFHPSFFLGAAWRVPALAGMTLREAAAEPRKRSDVVLMLKELENIKKPRSS
jgi:hypothetical protein